MTERNLTHDAADRLGEDTRNWPDGRPRDVGRTSGGGSLGHKQPEDVADATRIRNQPGDHRPDEPAQGDLQR